MSILKRFQKQDGFRQLLLVVESSSKKKQEQLLNAIAEENKPTALLLKKKMLTIDRVLNWNPMIIAELTSRVSDKVLAGLMVRKNQEQIDKIASTIPHNKMRLILSIVQTLQMSDPELDAIHFKIFEKVRELDSEGVISLRRIDPELDIEHEKVAS
jgi:flagellar motor switch protein FliG